MSNIVYICVYLSLFCQGGLSQNDTATCPPLQLDSTLVATDNVTSVEAGSDVNVTCETGFTLPDGQKTQNLRCQINITGNATWDGSLQSCSPVTCTTIPEVTSAHVTYSSVTYGSVLSITCSSGRFRDIYPSRLNLSCNATGEWEVQDINTTTLDCKYKTIGYVGCRQSSPGALNVSLSGTSSHSQCLIHCRDNNMLYSGFQGGDCYCGNLSAFGINVNNTGCNTSCGYNPDVMCGGADGRMSVYMTFDGCYSMTNSSIFMSALPIVGKSYVTCKEHCRGLDFPIAMVTRSYLCQCTNTTSGISAVRISPDVCSLPIQDLGEPFSAATTVRVWTLEQEPLLADSCENLYNGGICMHGYYYTSNNTRTYCRFKDDTVCDDYWVGYNGSCYYFSNFTATFSDSYSHCLSQNAHLVAIQSNQEQLILQEAFYNFRNFRARNNAWFVGLYDARESASFQWTDGGLVSYTSFLSSEPSRPFQERCVVVAREDDDVSWYDRECSDEENFICERRPDWYYGCIEVATADLSVALTHENMTLTLCSQKCLSVSRAYSAVSNRTCFCVDTVPSHVPLGWSSCDVKCPGHVFQPCGGVSANPDKTVIFVTGGGSPPAPAEGCEELELQGLTDDTFVTAHGEVTCTTSNSVLCPFSWVNIEGHCYKFMVGRTDNPATSCSQLGAYLVSLTDAHELAQVREILNRVVTLRYFDWWLTGLVDNDNNNVYRWSNGQLFNSSAFHLSVTNDNSFFAFHRDSNSSELITADPSKKPFICEKGDDYVGCFDVPTDAAILADYEDMTIPVCVELCWGQGHTYALLDVTSCWCSSTISMATAKSPTSCTSMCLTNKGQMCGGPAHVSAYSVAAFPEYSKSCSDFFNQGIMVPGTYVLDGTPAYCIMSDNSTCPTSPTTSFTGVGHAGYCVLFGFESKREDAAMADCRSWGGVLASTRDAGEMTFLQQVIKYSKTLMSSKSVTLGARDEFRNGLFSWADGSLMKHGVAAPGTDFTAGTGGVRMKTASGVMNTKKSDDKRFMCTTEKEYDACYDNNNQIQPIVANYSTMTFTLCRQLCMGQAKEIALLHVANCYCASVDELSNLNKVTSDPGCEVSCPGHSGQNCASGSKLRAYRIWHDDLPESCSVLYGSGVLYRGQYLINNTITGTAETRECGFDIHDINCPPGWIGHNRTCIQINPSAKSQTGAAELCFQSGGHLFTPGHSDTVQYISDLINAVPVWAHYSKWRTGAREVMLEGHVMLADGTYMTSAELAADTFKDDGCIVVDVGTLKLQRYNCSAELPYICETAPVSVSSGCHVTGSSPSNTFTLAEQMSVSQCMEFCRGQNESHFALNGSTCECYASYDVINSGICDTGCWVQPYQQCGSNESNESSFYDIASYTTAILSSCTQLQQYGVTMPGWYQLQRNAVTTLVQCFVYGAGYEPILGSSSGGVSASSEAPGHPAAHARLGSGLVSPSSWKPADNPSWLQANFPAQYLVKAVLTQGGQSLADQAWVTSFSLHYSVDSGGTWTQYSNAMSGNTDRSTVTNHFFPDPFVCDSIRLVPETSAAAAAMRVEFLGELYLNFNHSDRYVGCFAESDFVSQGTVTSADDCLAACTSTTKYPFMALADAGGTTDCTCGASVGHLGQADSSRCSHTCVLSTIGYKCGQTLNNGLAVYRTFEKRCPELSTPANATSTVSKVYNVPGIMTFQTQMTYTCVTGFEFPDSSTAKSVSCLQSNVWNESIPDCQVKHCPAPTDALNATRDANDTVYGTVITYTCDPGYVNNMGLTTQTTTCSDSKTWSVTPDDCTPRPCDTVPVLENADVLESVASVVYGVVITYNCRPSSMFSDNTTVKTSGCDQDGRWSEPSSGCQFYQCPGAPYLPGATYEYLDAFSVRYTCKSDFSFDDGSSEVNSTCGPDNTWSDVTVKCVFSASSRKRETSVCLSRRDHRIVGDVVQTSSRSRLGCGVICLQNPACRYYNYHNDPTLTDNCQLYVDTMASSIFEANTGWDSYNLRDTC
ncbi:uncharacterized protein [Haliotis cracherodii]|uniref:uncharacterized protein n=1 Tax=Haliotis cracherodii TaxID=6455 RepID=UPI0039E82BF2